MKKKKFADAHSILYYVNKDDVRGDAPKNPENDPQFNNWEKGVRDWLRASDYSTDSAPKDDCSEKDFSKFKLSVSIKSPSDGDTITASSFDISVKIDAPYGVDKATIEVDGNSVKSSNDSSFSYTYNIPDDKKNSSLSIKVSAKDDNGNSDSSSINIKTNVATPTP